MKAKSNVAKEEQERAALVEAFQACAGPGIANAWICKPSRGTKGQGIQIFTDPDALLQFADDSEAGVYVVQRYIERPLLLTGGRKFDIRMWVIAHSTTTVPLRLYLYREGVLRTASTAFSMDNLDDEFTHLTNHAVQEKHADFNTFEEGNELFFDDFQADLAKGGHPWDFRKDGIQQVRSIVEHSFRASWDILRPPDGKYNTFQVFGYDFMVDADYKVWLIEVNAAPCVTERLRCDFAEELVATVIDPSFPISHNESQSCAPETQAATTLFDLVYEEL